MSIIKPENRVEPREAIITGTTENSWLTFRVQQRREVYPPGGAEPYELILPWEAILQEAMIHGGGLLLAREERRGELVPIVVNLHQFGKFYEEAQP